MVVSVACHETTTPPVPTKLTFTIQPPATVTAGAQVLPAVAVAVQDAAGNTVTTATNSVTMTIGSNSPSGTLSGITTVAAVNGVATFFNLLINKAGAGYTLSAAASNLASANSTPFEVKTGPAAKLAFTAPPVTTIAGTLIPSVSVSVQDASGNTVTSANNTVFLSIGANPAGGVLAGITSTAAVAGVATFSNLSINRAGIGYALSANANGLGGVASNPFNITVGPASKLTFTGQPVSTPPRATIAPAVMVAVQDMGGNVVTTANHSITLAIGTNPAGANLSGITTVAAVNGVATFSNLSIDKAGLDYTLTAAAPNLGGGTSAPFSIRNPLVLTAASAGYFHACGVGTGGVAYCWGDNSAGQIGQPLLSLTSTPTAVVAGNTFAKLSAGRTHTCGVTTGGVAYCWGSNDFGQLGDGGSFPSGTPTAVSGGLLFAEVNAGYDHTCGVTTSGVGYCWGSNSSGELGNGTVTQKNVPTAVSGGLTFASITPGRLFTCGVTTSGVAHCWGVNDLGMLGNGTGFQSPVPSRISGQLTFATASAGGFHSCGLTRAGAAYCWGSNGFGELGNGTVNTSSTPVAVSGGLIFAMLSVGNRHNCGVTIAGAGYCWGDNTDGNLGDGTMAQRSTPQAVAGGLIFASISAGRFHSCGVTTNNEAYCWGSNSSGTLGDGTTDRSLIPVRVR